MIPTSFNMLGTGDAKKYYPPDGVFLTDWVLTRGGGGLFGDYFELDEATELDEIYSETYALHDGGHLAAYLFANDSSYSTSSIYVRLISSPAYISESFYDSTSFVSYYDSRYLNTNGLVRIRMSASILECEIAGKLATARGEVTPITPTEPLTYRVGLVRKDTYYTITSKNKQMIVYRAGKLKYIYASAIQDGKAVIVDLVSQRVFHSVDNGGNLPVISGSMSQQQYIEV